jgi:hypothetical protein
MFEVESPAKVLESI